MDTLKIIPFLALVVILIYVFSTIKGKIPDKKDQVPVPITQTTYTGVRSNDDKPQAELELVSPHGDHRAFSIYADGVLWQDLDQSIPRTREDAGIHLGTPFSEPESTPPIDSDKDGGKWQVSYIIHRYPIDYTTDLGCWIGFRNGVHNGSNGSTSPWLDCGLRLSPCRIGWGTIAPDLLASPNQAGVGISFYLPPQTVSSFWQHIGVGLAYCADYHGGSGWMPYCSLSTRF